jgi:hypothetical protein
VTFAVLRSSARITPYSDFISPVVPDTYCFLYKLKSSRQRLFVHDMDAILRLASALMAGQSPCQHATFAADLFGGSLVLLGPGQTDDFWY